MKYLVVLLVVFIVGWAMLRSSPRRRPQGKGRPRKLNAPENMVVCRHCGVHLPQRDAVDDASGAYCSEAHRIAGPAPR